MLKHLKKTLLNGIIALLPIIITVALLVWLLSFIENFFGYFLEKILGPEHYIPGLGFILGIVIFLLVGAFMNAWTIKQLYLRAEEILKKIPFIKTLYGSVRDLMNFFGDKNRKKDNIVVMVTFANMRFLGMITRENFEDTPPGLGLPGEVAVYLPMSYQIGGYTVLIPRSQIQPINMSIEDAMRFTVTAGMIATKAEMEARERKKFE